MFENLFKLSDHGTTVRIEVMAGLTTFLTMAYIIIVNPDIMSAAGMDKGALFVATCVAAAVGCLIMGLWANYPIALAPGLGLNAFFAFGVVGGMGVPWQTALGVIFLSGVFFLIITILPIRAAIINSIPKSLKMSISAGIGLFIGVIAMEISGITVDHPVTLVTLGEVASPQVLLVAIGFVGIIALDRLAVPGAIVLGIIGTTVLAHIFGLGGSTALDFSIPSLAPTFLQLDIAGAFQVSMISVIIAFLFVDMFDTAGTLIGVSHRAGLLDEDGKLPRMGKALSADSIATITGSLVGSSTVTSYIESAAGVREGGRTGLTAVTVGVLFILALLLAPVIGLVPRFATAPALLFVAVLMVRGLTEIDWEDVTEYAPAVLAAVVMPFTFSIAHGIAFGFIVYAAGKILTGRMSEASPILYIMAVLFVLLYGFGLIG
ncbi:MAG: NCS2 family permease [Rhodospirillaceae bacterium]|jgi:AGZA family xanthine/uracil permease-like MFS transporter|nr:NCS2 family permease [Rhodospirillaceae bacterium]MBT3929245.1 NCS2 family permease [Rhodospirillaceae bacterium]MBT4771014.1 NCS2 family permease [Rhodospirillaceae bacterium]MBT5359191.1 NCS2 family permease [Rhodospirillaceae bacterium]MBT5769061.1 NCS2 family permease [Rhodospirillaceae bacterium]